MSDREALAVVLHDAACRDRCEPQAMGEQFRQADAVLARWRLAPVEQEPAPHEVDMERFPACAVCGRDVQWDEDARDWKH